MPIYIESRDLAANLGFVAEHQYLIYVPVDEELNYDAWRYIGAFPTNGDGSLLTGNLTTDILFKDATADEWNMGDFFSVNFDEVEVVANKLGKDLLDVEVKDMVDEGYGGSAGSAAYVHHRELVNGGGALSEGLLWTYLVNKAKDISGEYTYNSVGLPGSTPGVNSNSFISSILRHAQDDGYSIGAFNTDANTVGNKTWLGTRGDDVLDGNTAFANGDEARDLFGGDGADTLIAGPGNSYLVAGADTDRDILIGNTGDDKLVGYFNQANYADSDSMSGGDGNDDFVIIDPDSALKGGMPDISGTPAAPTNFVHGATSSGDAVLIDGGSGRDKLDFSNLTNDVTIDFTNGSIVNVEEYDGSAGSDTVFADNTTTKLWGGDGVDTLSYEKFTSGVEIQLQEGGAYEHSSVGPIESPSWQTLLTCAPKTPPK